jgi:hypothetical protein
MMTYSKTLKTSLAAALLLAGVTTLAQGQAPGGSSAFGGAIRGPRQIEGSVVCEACSLNEVRQVQQVQPPGQHLYQLSYPQGQVVMKITAVNGSAIFDVLAGAHQLSVRATESVQQQLGAEENLFKEMEITGVLRGARTLDIASLTING